MDVNFIYFFCPAFLVFIRRIQTIVINRNPGFIYFFLHFPPSTTFEVIHSVLSVVTPRILICILTYCSIQKYFINAAKSTHWGFNFSTAFLISRSNIWFSSAIDWLFSIFNFKKRMMKKLIIILTSNTGRSQVTYVNIYIGWSNECQLY